MGVGAFMTMANAMALVLLVDGLSIMPVAANWSRAVVMTQVQFGLHLQFTWADRTGQFWQQWRRYMSLRVVTISLNQALFWTLVAWATLHYMLAYGICTITIGIVNYLTGDRFVFPDKQ
jgi:putative flippase GtrA